MMLSEALFLTQKLQPTQTSMNKCPDKKKFGLSHLIKYLAAPENNKVNVYTLVFCFVLFCLVFVFSTVKLKKARCKIVSRILPCFHKTTGDLPVLCTQLGFLTHGARHNWGGRSLRWA